MSRWTPLAILVVLLHTFPLFAQLSGTIISRDGAPLPGVTVSAFALESSDETSRRLRSESPEREALAEVATDEDGRFTLEVTDVDVATLRFLAEGFAPAGATVGSAGELGAFILRPATAVSGSVTHDGKPIAGAAVRWYTDEVELLARTDDKGLYEAPDPVVWRPSLEVQHPDYPPYRVEALPWDNYSAPALDVRLSSRNVKGTVTRADGEPAAGAALLVDGVPVGTTGTDGTFELALNPAWKLLEATLGESRGSVKRGAKKIHIKLSPAGRLAGRVLDERGRGLNQARVSVMISVLGRAPRRETVLVTSGDGSFATRPVPPGSYRVTVDRPGYSEATKELTVLPGARVAQDIVLSPACTVEGRVRDEDRRPIAAARVAIIEQRVPSFARKNAATGPDGHYVLRDVAGSIKTKLVVERAGHPGAGSEEFETVPGGRLSGIDVTLPVGHEVTGRVVDEEGNPVAGALVGSTENAQAIEMMFLTYPGIEEPDYPMTDRDGNFVVRLAKGTWFLAFRAPGYVTGVTEGRTVDGPTSFGEVVLRAGGELSGRVVRENGSPVEDAAVLLRDRELRRVRTTTDENGTFTLADLPKKKTQIMAAKSDGSRVVKQVEIPSTGLELVLPDVIQLRGRVIDAETKEPLRDFMLGIASSQPGGTANQPYHSDDGTFVIDAAVIEGLAVVASAAGYAETKKLVDLVDGAAPEPIEIALARGVRVYGTVTDQTGRRLEGVSVTAFKRMVAANGTSLMMRDSQMTTDSSGEFSFDSVSPGQPQFRFEKQGLLMVERTIEIASGEHRLDVEMSSGVALRGIVVDEAGAAIGGAVVRGSTSGERAYATAKADANGRFVLEPLAPGRASVFASAPGYADAAVRDVEIATTPELRVVMEQGATVAGRVVGLEPDDMQNVSFQIGEEGMPLERRVNSAGEFRIDGLTSGHVAIEAYARVGQGYRSAKTVEADLVAGQVTQVEIEFPAGNTVRGVVTVGDKALAGAQVVFRPMNADVAGYSSTRADDGGRYEVSGLTDGDYKVTVNDTATRRWFETSYVARGSGKFDMHFEEGRVDGRVVEAGSRKPIAGATVSVTSEGQTSVSFMTSSAVTDDDGRFVILSAAKGETRIAVKKEGYGAAVRQVRSEGTLSGIEIELTPSAGTKLRVVDARDGRSLIPIVAVEDPSGAMLTVERYQSTNDGVVSLDLAPGTYRIGVSARGYAASSLMISVPSEERRVGLTPGGKLIIRAPVDHVYRVTIRDSNGFTIRRWAGASEPTILVEGSETLYAVAPGEYRVEAELVSNGDVSVHTVKIEEGKTNELVLD